MPMPHSPHKPLIAIVGAGLAGCEAAWQLARRGLEVHLYEMRPQTQTPAHQSANCAELVCSNSFKSTNTANAHGLLKAELKTQASLVYHIAQQCKTPAGQALAVDRECFSQQITAFIQAHPNITLLRQEVNSLTTLLATYPYVLVASGPLTSPSLIQSLRTYTGKEWLYFHDAIAPIVHTDSLDMSLVFAASRYGKGGADYLNCPLDRQQYETFVGEIAKGDKIAFHPFESLRPFEGCLPIEVMVERGKLTLAYGPLKPVGLVDPATGKRPFAVVQLRREDAAGNMYNLVGFQTKLTWSEQRRVFRLIPGLQEAEFARYGSLHRNTFLNSPALLNQDLALQNEPRLFFCGQITGVEGYMESTAIGLYVAKCVFAHTQGVTLKRPSPKTMTGGLLRYVLETPSKRFQPINSAFGLLDAPAAGTWNKHEGKKAKKTLMSKRALEEMTALETEGRHWPSPAEQQLG